MTGEIEWCVTVRHLCSVRFCYKLYHLRFNFSQKPLILHSIHSVRIVCGAYVTIVRRVLQTCKSDYSYMSGEDKMSNMVRFFEYKRNQRCTCSNSRTTHTHTHISHVHIQSFLFRPIASADLKVNALAIYTIYIQYRDREKPNAVSVFCSVI